MTRRRYRRRQEHVAATGDQRGHRGFHRLAGNPAARRSPDDGSLALRLSARASVVRTIREGKGTRSRRRRGCSTTIPPPAGHRTWATGSVTASHKRITTGLPTSTRRSPRCSKRWIFESCLQRATILPRRRPACRRSRCSNSWPTATAGRLREESGLSSVAGWVERSDDVRALICGRPIHVGRSRRGTGFLLSQVGLMTAKPTRTRWVAQ